MAEKADRIKELVKKRATVKSKLTHFKNFVNDDSKNSDIFQLKKRLQAISEDFNAFESYQDELYLLHENEENAQTQEDERAQFTESYFEITSKAEKLIFDFESASTANPNGSQNGSQTNENSVQILSQQFGSHIRMPQMTLPKFNNTCENWSSFADSFKAAIHANKSLRDSEKLIYLKSCVTGKALSKIENLEITDRHYDVAWKILEKGFDDPVAAATKRIKAFFDLPKIQKASKASISEILDSATSNYSALKALNKPFLETFPVYAIVSKLDDVTRQKWKEHAADKEFPTMEELLDFLHKKCRVLEEDVEKVVHHTKINNNDNKNFRRVQNSVAAISTRENSTPFCHLCKGVHYTNSCEKIVDQSPEQRFDTIKNAKLCINCFKPHTVSQCKSRNSCKTCNKKHNTLLHRENAISSHLANCNVPSQVILATAVIDILDNNGYPHACRVLLDPGSQSHFITERMASKLKLPIKNINIPVTGIHQLQTNLKHALSATIFSKYNQFSTDLNFLVMPKITGRLPSMPIDRKSLKIPENIVLADPNFDKPGEIDALLGAEISYALICMGRISLQNQSALLIKTQLGWILSGKISSIPLSTPLICNVVTDELNKTLEKFWAVEEGPDEKTLTHEEKLCEKHFDETTVRDPKTGRFTVRLPFNDNKDKLGNSYYNAHRRFLSLERSFKNKPELWKQYVDFMEEYEKLGHMTKTNDADINDGYYLAHHAVLREASLTTKLRVVFDASAKSNTGFSLNDILMNGPEVQSELISILVRSRTFKYVLTADIDKFYRQFEIAPADQKYQKVLWRSSPDNKIETYLLTTITYGTKPGKYQASKPLTKLSELFSERYPLGAVAVKRDFYVDDLLTGANNREEALLLRDEIIEITKSAQLKIRKWASNDPILIRDLANKSDDPLMILDLEKTIKTLGVFWNARTDAYYFKVNIDKRAFGKVTKRIILSTLASFRDYFGTASPVIIVPKMLLQALWELKCGWDEELPKNTVDFWINFITQLPIIEEEEIPRNVIIDDYDFLEIHGFCDASDKAYGANLYVRSVDKTKQVSCKLLNAKSRVAPLKSRSIPRLELCAAQLLMKLLTSTMKSLDHLVIGKICLWSDSTIVLHWLKTPPHTLKTFVRNRVAEIQENPLKVEWRHVRSEDNPADMISRGITPQEFVGNKLWFNGPDWLKNDETDWPRLELDAIEIPERRSVAVFNAITSVPTINFERYSTMIKIKRIVAFCIRFIETKTRKSKITGPLSASEVEIAEKRIIKLVQRSEFSKEIATLKKDKLYKGNLSPLSPFLDNEKILRVGGRLKLSNLTFNEKHPILLPAKHHITELIIRETHNAMDHAGIQGTLNATRSKFWIISGKNAVKKVIHHCIPCFRAKPNIPNHIMGDLPKNRVNCSQRPFLHTGVDFCGPFYIKEKRFRNRNKEKIYVAIFVCFAVKAVHIEPVGDLTSEAFLAAFSRFIKRKGHPSDVYSDNGTNFVGADNKLNEIGQFLQSEQMLAIHDDFSNRGVQWHFNPPNSPHFGGLWEAGVKSFKHHFVRTVGEKLLTWEAFLTYATEIEGILNSRPLTPMSSDPNDLRVLTPAHFIIGDSMTNLPERRVLETPDNRLSAWENVQKLKQTFWVRWSKEYLNEQTVKKKWHTGNNFNAKIGSIVLMKDDNLPPLRWKLARITELHPGKDGIVRVATVTTADSQYKRCIKKLAPLPIDETESKK